MSFPANALWDGLTPEQRKEMAAIAAGWLVGRQPLDDNVPMEDAAGDDPTPPSPFSFVAPPSSSIAPFSPVHCTMTIGEARGRYMDMVREEQFRETQADAAYNHHLLSPD